MLRKTALLCASGMLALVSATAAAQAPHADAVDGGCRIAVQTIYYPHGESTPSEQTQLVISRIGEEAARCRPQAIDLVTRIDTNAEGPHALMLAMSRLSGVADALVAGGVPAARIRIAAQGDDAVVGDAMARSPMSEIVVLFRQTPNVADTAAAPAPVVTSPPDAI